MSESVNVLFIEDNPGDARRIKEAISSAGSKTGVHLEWVDRLEVGMARLASNQIQAVLLNLNLPDSEGLDTLQRVLTGAPSIPVIVMTGQADEAIAIQAVQAGAQDYLIKGQVDGRLLTRSIQYAIQRKQAEVALQASAERFRGYFKLGVIGMAITSPGKGFLEVNDRMCEILGYERAELMQIPWDTITYPDDLAVDLVSFNQLLFGQINGYSMEKRFIHKAGEIVYTRLSVSSVRRADGSVDYLVALVEDISVRKRAEDALRESEARYRLATHATNDVIWEWSSKTKQLSWTENAQLVFGYSPEEIGPNESWWDNHIHPEDRQRVIAELNELMAGRETIWSSEYRFLLKDGSFAYISDHGYIERDASGAAIRMVGAMSNVTERKRAEEALAASESRYRTLFESNPHPMWVYDVETLRFLAVNDTAVEHYGYSREEFLSMTIKEIRPPEDVATLVTKLRKAQQDLHIPSTWRHQKKDSTLIDVEITSHALDWEQRPARLVLANDISRRKQAEEEIKTLSLFPSENPNPVLRIDRDGKVLYGNLASQPLLDEWNCAVGGYLPANWIKLTADLIASNSRETVDIICQHTTYSIMFVPILDKGYINLYGRDITERKKAEEALQEKESLLSEAQRIGHIGSWSHDILADTLMYSDEMYRLLDISPQEFQHTREGFLGAVYAPDRPMLTKWMESIKAGRPVGDVEFLVFRKNSEMRYIRCRGALEFDNGGRPARFIGTAQDVTERKLSEIQIRQQIERLTALRKIDQAITSSFNLNVTLDVLLLQVTSQLQVDAAAILLLDPDERTLEYAAGKGFHTQAIERTRLHMDDSQAGRAARERRTIHIASLENKPDARLRTTLGAKEGFVCYLAVPLIVKRNVKGVLELFHRAPLQPYPEWLEFLDALSGQAAIAIDNATLFENLQRSNNELSRAYDATIEGWSRALDLRDKETEGHTQRVTEMTLKLARAFRLPEEELVHIRRGGLLHDIGKMGVPDNILLKPGALTEEEWARMRSHPQYAYDLLKPIAFLAPALDIPYCHHEKWDGTGYPRGLQGKEIPLVARLFAVVDVWDALCSDRPYRRAWTREKTLEHIKSLSGTYFDPEVVEIFLELIKE